MISKTEALQVSPNAVMSQPGPRILETSQRTLKQPGLPIIAEFLKEAPVGVAWSDYESVAKPKPLVMHSSARCDWVTPGSLFYPLNREFQFELDVAAEAHNAKVSNYLGPDHPLPDHRDGLAVSWLEAVRAQKVFSDFPAVFMNPPYSVKLKLPIMPWLAKAVEESEKGLTVVGIIPANVQTKWWNDYVRKAYEVRFLTHRVAFDPPPGVTNATSAGHNIAVIVWKPLRQLGYINFTEPSYRYVEYR